MLSTLTLRVLTHYIISSKNVSSPFLNLNISYVILLFMQKFYLGVDLGGTKILTGVADSKGMILHKIYSATLASRGKKTVINNIINSIQQILKESKISLKSIAALGIGAPGPIISEKGIIVDPPNLPGWKRVPLKKILESKFRIKTILENDANAAALGESVFGAGKRYLNFIYITISTGIGGGIILDKKIYHGSLGAAGEIGHTTVLPNGPRCGCKNHGCLEALASGLSMARQAGLKNAIEVWQSAKNGNQKSRRVIQKAGIYIGIALANAVNLLNPELIIIGGGVSNMGRLLLKPIQQSVKKHALKIASSKLKIVRAKLGALAGLKGAIALCLK